MHKSEAGKNEIKDINGAHATINRLLDRAKSGDIAGIKANVEDLKAVKKFVESNLEPDTKNQNGDAKLGVYSIAHEMDNILYFLEQQIVGSDPSFLMKAAAGAEQLKRLMTNGTRSDHYKSELRGDETNERIGSTTALGELPGYGENQGGRATKRIEVPNLVEVPKKWKDSSDGKKFDSNLQTFFKTLDDSKPLSDSDISLLNEMMELVRKCYDGLTLSYEQRTEVPFARDLILINLHILATEAVKAKGKLMPRTPQTINVPGQISALRNFDSLQFGEAYVNPSMDTKAKEISQKRKQKLDPQPKFIPTPFNLMKRD